MMEEKIKNLGKYEGGNEVEAKTDENKCISLNQKNDEGFIYLYYPQVVLLLDFFKENFGELF